MIRRFACGALTLVLLFCLSACTRSGKGTADEFPREETLRIGIAWGEPNTFNPLHPAPSWPVQQEHTVIYQTLFYFDPEKGTLLPQLGSELRSFSDRIEVDIHEAARWHDGKPVTARDVAYTFNHLYRINPGFPAWQYFSAVDVVDAAAERPRTVAFRFRAKDPNPLMVQHWLTLNAILPRHVWEPLLAAAKGDFNELIKHKADQNPIGSGPYRLHSYSAEKIVAERFDAYWGNAALHGGKLPAPRFLIAPIYKSNDHYSLALQQGRIDAANTFIPRIWLKARKGVRAWFDEPPYFPPACMPTAFINHLRAPLNDVRFRRAMAFAINYDDIRELAVSGYSVPHEPGFILPFGVEKRYFNAEDAQRFGTRFDPARAREELAAGGYRAVFRDGELIETRNASGARVPTLFIQCPAGWSDWESMVRIMVRGMREVGIDVREQFVDSTAYYRALPLGDFDLIISTPSPVPSPAEPWARFDFVLNSRDWAPAGERMFTNMGRFNRPGSPEYVARFDELLARIPVVTDEAERTALYRELNRLCMEVQPAIPLVYRPKAFYEFTEKVWTGFPTAANPYLPPTVPTQGAGTLMLWHLRPAGAATP